MRMQRVGALLCMIVTVSFARPNWDAQGTATFTLTQVALHNWAAGGQNTIGIAGLINYRALYSDSLQRWETTADIGYGLTKLADAPFRKSDDRIIVISVYGKRSPDSSIQYSALLDFRTQLDNGYRYGTNAPDTLISAIFSPATINLGLGATYTPSSALSLTLTPVTGRTIFVLDRRLQDGSLGVDSGKAVRFRFGAALTATLTLEPLENVLINSKLAMFAPYNALSAQLVNWNTIVTLRINKYLTANLALDVVYDPTVIITRDDGSRGPTTQVRNVFGLGITVPF